VLARHKVLFVFVGLLGLMFGGVVAAAAYLNQQISTIQRIDVDLDSEVLTEAPGTSGSSGGSTGSQRPPEPTGAAAESLNILLGGVDAGESSRIIEKLGRAWVPGSHRSDTIMVLHLTADRRQAYLISVPRDTWVPIDDYGMAKINAALSFGGPALFVQTMEQFTGLRMDHLAIADWIGFKEVTDDLGGVRIQQSDGTTSTLDGAAALEYVRERKSLPRGDLDRIHRQQYVLRALSDELVSGGTLGNPAKLASVLDTVTDNIAVDKSLTDKKMRSIAVSLRNLSSDDVVHVTVPVERFDRIDGQSVVIVDEDKAKELFGAAIGDEMEEYLAANEADLLPNDSPIP
jgi:LCP family protein required for cell wall assembly